VNPESEFINQFISPVKRDRYLTLLRSKKGRRKLLQGLDHLNDLNMRYAHLLPSNTQTIDEIEVLLKKNGASDHCHIISANEELDGSEMLLRDALEQTVGKGWGTIISCIPGKLAYFEGEDADERYILQPLRSQ
jgi:hypothetical protein